MSPVPVVSVVTPVYNGARYLAECIESVLRQTYSEWEYVIVDNVSSDGTGEIAEGYASRDARIRVIRAKEFLGVYGNHNRALRAMDARSRYCKLVHADDWLYPECLERMVSVAERNPSVGVVGAYRLVGRDVDHGGLLPYTQEVLAGREVVRSALLGGPCVTGSPTSLLFRAELVRAERGFFDEAFWHGDSDAVHRVLLESEFGFAHQVLTFTRMHEGALTSFSARVNSFGANVGRMLIRYGPKVLTRDEYRTRVRAWLRAYTGFLLKKRLLALRRPDPAFHDFHARELAHMRAEAGDDAEVQRKLWFAQKLVAGSPGRRTTEVAEFEAAAKSGAPSSESA